jgi:hypothetical protein
MDPGFRRDDVGIRDDAGIRDDVGTGIFQP